MTTINFKDFMKKYSMVSNNFLDDFLSFYNVNTNTNDLVIDLDKVVKWLKTRKDKLKETLVSSYKKNVDYKIIKNIKKGKGSGGSNKELILITPDCFKRICQLTRSSKGDLVRDYFIQLEVMINKYKDYIIDGLNRKIRKLENNQKPYINKEKGVIYVFKVADKENDSVYKVGRTENIKKRLATYNTSVADNIDVLFVYECDNIKRVEKCIHNLMKEYQYRKYKEVYEVNIDILKEAIDDCGDVINKYKKDNVTRKQTGGKLFVSFVRKNK
jgi:phage anti-repressor protein